MPARWKTIIWSNDGLVYWCIHVSLGLHELRLMWPKSNGVCEQHTRILVVGAWWRDQSNFQDNITVPRKQLRSFFDRKRRGCWGNHLYNIEANKTCIRIPKCLFWGSCKGRNRSYSQIIKKNLISHHCKWAMGNFLWLLNGEYCLCCSVTMFNVLLTWAPL